jgi:uncharacterized protein
VGKRLFGFAAAAALSVALCGPVLGDADPSVHQIYEAAASGQLERAQQMMDQVLRDHPNSSKAHFVQAELYAREGKTTAARVELARAEEIAPGLPKENPRAVAELKAQLGGVSRVERPGFNSASTPHISWGLILLLAGVGVVLLMLFRRRAPYPQPPVQGIPPGTTGPYAPGGYGAGAPGASGMGSAVAGGLAGGLAAGAGIVAGEELARRVFERGPPEAPPANDAGASSNSDLGGNDFGVSDAGSWDDGSGDSGGGGGGDDWT